MSEPSSRMLALLSLLQVPRDWPGTLLADRLGVSPRTIRRDVDRLRELGYNVAALRGSDGGYRLDAGSQIPPLLLDDDQVIALTVALQVVPALGADIGDAADRALATLRRVMPSRIRHRVAGFTVTAMPANQNADLVAPDVLRVLASASHAHEIVRFDYQTGPSRRVEPHGVVASNSRWYLVAFDLDRNDWRSFRVDRIIPKMPTGLRFSPRPTPGGSAVEFLRRRFRGSDDGEWSCVGQATMHIDASAIAPYIGDGSVEDLGTDTCRVQLGAWSWNAVAAKLAQFDADFEDASPPELQQAVVRLGARLSAGGR
ncbi:DeoR family transcriptional regulator [Rhodococcoides trifolii]|uniref:DeoR family transcriptional regulator n=1 Tax=Rhodococcoides trifolii TaxID=908250 RepID=A0A917CUA0_9NOCA|nr:WYL domain-containing protein [Rhodococcus trifolii]GGF99068.1 DeoR family transcriptional regulator [Rhodococcus trifolii]